MIALLTRYKVIACKVINVGVSKKSAAASDCSNPCLKVFKAVFLVSPRRCATYSKSKLAAPAKYMANRRALISGLTSMGLLIAP